jgi:hypothetical protein
MKVASILYRENSFEEEIINENLNFEDAQLVTGFGSRELVSKNEFFNKIKSNFPNSQLVLYSSTGEIYENEVFDNTISLIAIQFLSIILKTSELNIDSFASSFDTGKKLIENLPQENLKFIFVFSDGGNVNGSELVKGIDASKKDTTLIIGGLTGDGARFKKTVVASDVATGCLEMNGAIPKLALLISRVGRKLILGNKIDEKVEAISKKFENQTMLTGFYRYGEISPLKPMMNCVLHN